MAHVAFMPWVKIISSETILGCRFLPYDATDSAIPDDVHKVFSSYRGAGGQSLTRATLIEVDGAVMEVFDASMRRRVFRAASLVAFTALLRREQFRSAGYVNADSFHGVVEPCGDAIAVTTNRRSGSSTVVRSRSDYRVHCPDHVTSGIEVTPDARVLHAFVAATADDHVDTIDEVLLQLLRAESDDPQVTDLMQLMLFSGAIQRLLGLYRNSKIDELSPAVETLFATAMTWKAKPAAVSSRSAVAASTRTLREAWYRDFYLTRHDYAHGRITEERKPHWSVEEHLLMASFVVPRLLLLRLQQWSLYTLTENDRREFRAIDRLLCLDNLFGKCEAFGAERWCWQDALRVLTTESHPDGTEVDVLWPHLESLDHSQFEVQTRRL